MWRLFTEERIHCESSSNWKHWWAHTVHSAHFTLHTAHCKVHTSHCAVCTMHSHTVHHSAHYTVHSAHCIVHSAQCTVHIPQQVEISFLQRKKVGISRKTDSHRRAPLIAPKSTNKLPRHGMRFNRFSQSRILTNQFHQNPRAQFSNYELIDSLRACWSILGLLWTVWVNADTGIVSLSRFD